MKQAFLLLVAAAVALTACDKPDIAKNTSQCIEKKTIALEKSACEAGASVKEYSFQDQLIYIFDPGNCLADGSSEVTDADCNTLGYLGGFIGNTKINGEEIGAAELQRVIWQQ